MDNHLAARVCLGNPSVIGYLKDNINGFFVTIAQDLFVADVAAVYRHGERDLKLTHHSHRQFQIIEAKRRGLRDEEYKVCILDRFNNRA